MVFGRNKDQTPAVLNPPIGAPLTEQQMQHQHYVHQQQMLQQQYTQMQANQLMGQQQVQREQQQQVLSSSQPGLNLSGSNSGLATGLPQQQPLQSGLLQQQQNLQGLSATGLQQPLVQQPLQAGLLPQQQFSQQHQLLQQQQQLLQLQQQQTLQNQALLGNQQQLPLGNQQQQQVPLGGFQQPTYFAPQQQPNLALQQQLAGDPELLNTINGLLASGQGVVVHPTIVQDHIHRHDVLEIQPVIHREVAVAQTEVVQEHLQERTVAAPIHTKSVVNAPGPMTQAGGVAQPLQSTGPRVL